jgi:hypoxanthine phosphoribosyltransferase
VDFDTVLKVINGGGVVATLVFLIYAIGRGVFVPGTVYRDVLQDRDDWRDISMTTTDAGQRAVKLAEGRRASRR